MAEWNKVVETTEKVTKHGRKTKTYKLVKNYGDVLANGFHSINKVCVPSFKHTVVQHPEDVLTAAFFRSHGRCKGKKFGCQAWYSFTVHAVPNERSEYVNIAVRKTSGRIFHPIGKQFRLKRPLKGDNRKEAKKHMKNKIPSVFRRELFKDADPGMLAMQNYDIVKSLKVLQTASQEDKQSEDFHNDVLTDLLATYFTQKSWDVASNTLTGFVQRISIVPFMVVLFSVQQLKYLKAVAAKEKVVLFIDATGKLCQRLPPPFDQKMVFYYGVVVKPGKGVPAVPVAEFYSSSQSAESIQYCLIVFLNEYSIVANIRGLNYRVARIEVDFARAQLAAVIRVFHGSDTTTYITLLWRALVDKEALPNNFIAVHICRIHFARMWRRRLLKIFTGKTSTAAKRNFWTKWMWGFYGARDMFSIYRRMYDLVTISGSLYYTDEVQDLVENITGRTDKSGQGRWSSINLEDINPADPFCRRTPFGYMAFVMAQNIRRRNDVLKGRLQTGDGDLEENPYFCNSLLDYALITFFPYAPMFTSALFELLDMTDDGDNTNAIEGWINLLRNRHFGGAYNMRISRLARSHYEFMKGQVKYAAAETNVLPELDAETGTQNNFVELSDHGMDSDEDKKEPPTSTSKKSKSQESKSTPQRSQKSPEKEKDLWNRKGAAKPRKEQPNAARTMPLIPWNGETTYESKRVKLLNTCNIDCTLQILYFMYHYTAVGKSFLSSKQDTIGRNVKKIFEYMKMNNFGLARLLWIQKILRRKITATIDLFDTERENGILPLKPWFSQLLVVTKCKNANCPGNLYEKKGTGSFSDINADSIKSFTIILDKGEIKSSWCRYCRSDATITYEIDDPSEVVVFICDSLVTEKNAAGDLAKVSHCNERDVPKFIKLKGFRYRVFAYTMFTGNHFYAVFLIDGDRYVYDGMKSESGLERRRSYADAHGVSCVWLFRDH